MERPSAQLDCSAGLTFAFAYAASETSAIRVVRQFMKYDSKISKYFDAFNRVCSRVSFLPSFENLWERDSAPMGVAPEIVVYCLAIEDNLKSSFYTAFCQSKYFAFEIYGSASALPWE